MFFDQLVELFELRLLVIDVAESEVHVLDQERCFSVSVGTLRARFGPVPLVPDSSAFSLS